MGREAQEAENDRAPLFSTLLSGGDGPDLIEYFLAELRPQVRALRSAVDERNTVEMQRIGSHLGGAAGGFGFGVIGEAALDLQFKSRDPEVDFESLREQADKLIELCRRAFEDE